MKKLANSLTYIVFIVSWVLFFVCDNELITFLSGFVVLCSGGIILLDFLGSNPIEEGFKAESITFDDVENKEDE